MRNEPDELLADFEGGRIDPARFPHRDLICSGKNCLTNSTSGLSCSPRWRVRRLSYRAVVVRRGRAASGKFSPFLMVTTL